MSGRALNAVRQALTQYVRRSTPLSCVFKRQLLSSKENPLIVFFCIHVEFVFRFDAPRIGCCSQRSFITNLLQRLGLTKVFENKKETSKSTWI
jgi:hypothetical protein